MTQPRAYSLPRCARLSGSSAFSRVFERKAKRDLGWITIHAAANELPMSRLGLSIGARVGKATRRVLLKRRVREAFRLSRSHLPVGMDIVVSARDHDDRMPHEYAAAIVSAAQSLGNQLGLTRSS